MINKIITQENFDRSGLVMSVISDTITAVHKLQVEHLKIIRLVTV